MPSVGRLSTPVSLSPSYLGLPVSSKSIWCLAYKFAFVSGKNVDGTLYESDYNGIVRGSSCVLRNIFHTVYFAGLDVELLERADSSDKFGGTGVRYHG